MDPVVMGTRKRSRYDVNAPEFSQTPNRNVWTHDSVASAQYSDAKSPPPLANDQYELAGGMDVQQRFRKEVGDHDDYFQLQYQRRGLWSTPASPYPEAKKLFASNAVQESTNGAKPWMLNQIFSAVGGVAGRLIHFCSAPFRGFQAGGGQGYTINQGSGVPGLDTDESVVFGSGAFTPAPIQRPLPGGFPEDDYGVASMDSVDNEVVRPSAKRMRTEDNWVMVSRDGGTDSRASSPRLSDRRVPTQHSRSPSQIPRPVSRTGNTSTPIKRPSLIPVSRRTTLDRRMSQASLKAEPIKPYGSPRTYNRQSYNAPVMFPNGNTTKGSPLPKESQRLINKMRHDELEDDARMRRMSGQMAAMLREAQEALGSKIEVTDDFRNYEE